MPFPVALKLPWKEPLLYAHIRRGLVFLLSFL